MTFRAICVALLLSTLPIAGCGTVANLSRQKPGEGGVSPFGGVRQDMACIKKATNGEVGFRTHPRSESEEYPQRALVLFCAADLPFSLIGDILTWPYAVAYSCINQPIPTAPVVLIDSPATQAVPTTPIMPTTPPMPIPIPPVTNATAEGQPQTPP
jgi:uncharacterized protein YceK